MVQHFKFLKKKLNRGTSALRFGSSYVAIASYLIFKATQLCYKYLYDTGIGYRYLDRVVGSY